MYIEEKTASSIINMNPFPEKGYIDHEVAARQFQVVLKGFNHLIQPGNNYLYIADEVGLGKTYIAIGIASLLRHFSDHPDTYSDAIIVPKRNLQHKWVKEIRNFISNNYTPNDNIVKSVINKPIGFLDDESVMDRLQTVDRYTAQYILMRNSSFSLASDRIEENESAGKWMRRLSERLPKEQRAIFDSICKKHRRNDILIKRAYGVLLNTLLPEIDLLIVDEAHNYKHGISEHVSIRNQLASRLFGSVKLDQELFEDPDFVQLQDLYRRDKVKKLLLLSATPFDNGLHEIKNQLDVFLPSHEFQNIKDEERLKIKIEKRLNHFLIRGAMHIKVNDEEYSRNGYRHEHRLGNVEMQEIAEPQTLKDDKTTAILGLLQYKTIKELKLNNNNSFEMGMLAGFESFSGRSDYERQTLEDKSNTEAKDEHVISTVINSYYKNFGKYPPHPKQESLVNELFKLMIQRKKALVFVRRIASVREIERNLFQKYSEYLISKVKKVKGRRKLPPIEILLNSSKNDNIRDEIEKVLDRIADRIFPLVKHQLYEIADATNREDEDVKQILNSDLRELYHFISDNRSLEKFRYLIKEHALLTIVRQELKDISVRLLKRKWKGEFVVDEDAEDHSLYDNRLEEEKAPYFFQRFFYNEGNNFKKRSYTKNWYELNYLLVNDFYFSFSGKTLFTTNNALLSAEPDLSKTKTDVKKYEIIQKKIEQSIKSSEISTEPIHKAFRKETFLTILLTKLCKSEFMVWLDAQKIKIRDKQYSEFIEELDDLTEILKSIFRQGSGLLPAFVADAKSGDESEFAEVMVELLEGEFDFVLEEIKDVINDYEKLIERNFDRRERIRYNLIQQLPVSGLSGQHKKDVRKTAVQFRMPGYPYILIATDILKEGEDLHTYCANIYHYGIAWNPSDMEQRTGRIDRIDSLSYNRIMEDARTGTNKIHFGNKLQVFYPYLADTLEVNQMVKLFRGMAEFTQVFYNDLSQGIKKDATTSVDEMVIDIPKQESGLLTSRYDYYQFISVHKKGESRKQNFNTGITKAMLQESLSHLYNLIIENKDDHIFEPEHDSNRLIISGTLKVRGDRHGPFRLYYDHSVIPGDFVLVVESLLGRVQVFGRQNNMLIVEDEIKNKDIVLTERNSYIWTRKYLHKHESDEIAVKQLKELIHITDALEEKITGEDVQVEL